MHCSPPTTTTATTTTAATPSTLAFNSRAQQLHNPANFSALKFGHDLKLFCAVSLFLSPSLPLSLLRGQLIPKLSQNFCSIKKKERKEKEPKKERQKRPTKVLQQIKVQSLPASKREIERERERKREIARKAGANYKHFQLSGQTRTLTYCLGSHYAITII